MIDQYAHYMTDEGESNRKLGREGKEKENTFDRIYEVVRQIPRGKVATYGQIAALAGNRRWSRVVGYALCACPDSSHIPCYRVVNRLGEVSSAFDYEEGNRQIELLEADGIPCPGGKVDLSAWQWARATIDYIPRQGSA